MEVRPMTGRGKLLLGAKAIAAHAFRDETRWRSIYNAEIQRELGLFMLAKRIAGDSDVIDQRLDAKQAAALAGAPRK
jgi:hypothetical protein